MRVPSTSARDSLTKGAEEPYPKACLDIPQSCVASTKARTGSNVAKKIGSISFTGDNMSTMVTDRPLSFPVVAFAMVERAVLSSLSVTHVTLMPYDHAGSRPVLTMSETGRLLFAVALPASLANFPSRLLMPCSLCFRILQSLVFPAV